MTESATVRARISPELKDQAAAVLAQTGLTVSDAIRILLTRVAVEKKLPFESELREIATAPAAPVVQTPVKPKPETPVISTAPTASVKRHLKNLRLR